VDVLLSDSIDEISACLWIARCEAAAAEQRPPHIVHHLLSMHSLQTLVRSLTQLTT
jgi:hypothetical protein